MGLARARAARAGKRIEIIAGTTGRANTTFKSDSAVKSTPQNCQLGVGLAIIPGHGGGWIILALSPSSLSTQNQY